MAAAAAGIRALVAAGDVPPRARLPAERELAARLGASRSTLREAIRQLVESGVLESRRGSGTYVCDIDLREVCAVRLQLEPFAAALAAERAGADDLAELERLCAALPDRLGDPAAFAAADHAIHRAIAVACGNRVLAGALGRLTDLTELSRAVTATRPGTRRRAARDLERLTRALAAGDAPAARAAMRRHLLHVVDSLETT